MTDVKNAPDQPMASSRFGIKTSLLGTSRSPRGTSGWLRGISGTDRLLYLAVAGGLAL